MKNAPLTINYDLMVLDDHEFLTSEDSTALVTYSLDYDIDRSNIDRDVFAGYIVESVMFKGEEVVERLTKYELENIMDEITEHDMEE